MIREALMAAMMNANKGNNEDGQENQQPNPDNPDVRKIKKDWNDFLSWMKSKGVQGKPELDKGDLGNKYFKEYIKANPQTSLNENVIPIIRQEYIRLRDRNVNDILNKGGKFDIEVNGKKTALTGEQAKPYIHRFMGHILNNEMSENPNYVGQHLTQTPFPPAIDKYYEDGVLVKENKIDEYSVADMEKLKKERAEFAKQPTKVVLSTTKKQ